MNILQENHKEWEEKNKKKGASTSTFSLGGKFASEELQKS